MSELIPTIFTEVLGAIAASAVALGIPYIVYKFNALNDFHVVLYGVEGVDSFDGLIGSVELLNKEVEEHEDRLDEQERKTEELYNSVQDIEEYLDENREMIDEATVKAKNNKHQIEKAQSEMDTLNQRVEKLYNTIKDRQDR